MNRNTEYESLLRELESTPAALDGCVERAQARLRARRRRLRILGIPAGTLAACFAGFVLLVNLFPTFAYACGGVPVLRELAKAVAWSPSLSAAVENAYVQPIEQSKTVNGITATVHYVIVDQKQVNLFFTLEGEGYESLSAEMPEFSPHQACSILGADFRQSPGTMLRFALDYGDEDVPETFSMTFSVTGERADREEAQAPAAISSLEEDLLTPPDHAPDTVLATFTFDLRFDPADTAPGRHVAVNETFTLDGQTLTVTDVEIYPTHVRVNVEGDGDNTAWLKGLDFYLENEDGQRFGSISSGVIASGDTDTPAMVSYRLESPYFARCDSLTLHITGARWLEKAHERVHIDLAAGSAEWMPEGVTLQRVQKEAKGWVITCLVDDGFLSTPFAMTFYDREGNACEMRQMGMSTHLEGGKSELMMPLPDYTDDEVWLEAQYSHTSQEPVPVVIPIV